MPAANVPILVFDGVANLPPDANGAVVGGSNAAVAAAYVFNDAGFGADDAGVASLPLLDSDGIAAATVAADSACIGDGQSTLTLGIISAVNDAAYRLGARVGDTARDTARVLAERA